MSAFPSSTTTKMGCGWRELAAGQRSEFQVASAVARAMNIELPPGQDSVNALVDRLRLRQCLIILDNCEHVIDAVAAFAEAVLEQSHEVKLLTSSQELLGVEGEQVFRLRSLGEPDAAALFTERAHGADARFKITAQNRSAVAAICRRLDGIPLAIEMAAARAPSLGCEGVLERLDDRFRVLTGGRRTALPRQRTLLATLDWSHGLLSEGDAAVFRRLSVFSGGFSSEGASEVADGRPGRQLRSCERPLEPGRQVARGRRFAGGRSRPLPPAGNHSGLCAGKTCGRGGDDGHAATSCRILPEIFAAPSRADYFGLPVSARRLRRTLLRRNR